MLEIGNDMDVQARVLEVEDIAVTRIIDSEADVTDIYRFTWKKNPNLFQGHRETYG